jgi:histidyl-tRNA synthetase
LVDAAQLRSLGYQVEYPLKNQGFGKQFKSANQSGARFALIYGSEELEKGVVKVRDLATGNESEIVREYLLKQVGSLIESGLE